jgi:hypothetical protein
MLRLEGICAELDLEALTTLAAEAGLTVQEMAMKSPKGARHWHLRKPGVTGTLEITWLPSGELVIEARANRSADWQVGVADRLAEWLSLRR